MSKKSQTLRVRLNGSVNSLSRLVFSDPIKFVEAFGYTCLEHDVQMPYQFATNEVICEKRDA